MSPEVIGAIGIGVMLVLMFLGINIGVCMALVGIGGFFAISGPHLALSMTGIVPYSNVATYTLSVLPVFLLMGEFADISGLMRDSYRAANTWLGSLPGGLAMASILGAAFFSAVSGSSMACAALMCRVALPNLLDYKYDPRLAAGAIAAGGTLGNLVPPGIAFVFYALMSETSVGALYIAAIIPGILLTFMYLVQIYIQCKLNPSLGPPGEPASWKKKIIALKYTWALIVLFLVVMGGIWFGIFTATEAGAIGAVGTFLYALARRTVNGQTFFGALRNTLRTSGMFLGIVIGAMLFTAFVTVSRLPDFLTNWVISFHLSAVGLIIAIMVTYFLLGTFMDVGSMILLTLPIFLTMVKALGIDLIWFGVLVIVQVELANISPPTGLNIFVIATMCKERGISMGTIFRGVLPFCLTMLGFNAILIAFPQITMFLVNAMRGPTIP
jgi:tripartite ATP-independent transporter DctM subunit